ncbi:hypothetical protein MRX96_015981 [Rhipicephalus microplus]
MYVVPVRATDTTEGQGKTALNSECHEDQCYAKAFSPRLGAARQGIVHQQRGATCQDTARVHDPGAQEGKPAAVGWFGHEHSVLQGTLAHARVRVIKESSGQASSLGHEVHSMNVTQRATSGDVPALRKVVGDVNWSAVTTGKAAESQPASKCGDLRSSKEPHSEKGGVHTSTNLAAASKRPHSPTSNGHAQETVPCVEESLQRRHKYGGRPFDRTVTF